MHVNMVGAFRRNFPYGTEIAFAKGMERLGHTVQRIDPFSPLPEWNSWFDEYNDADATLIFKLMPGPQHLANCKGPVIVYQPDDARFPHITQMMVETRAYADFLLTFDGYGVELARQLRYRNAEVLLLTADDELYCPPASGAIRDIDVSFIGNLSHPTAHASRRRMLDVVQTEADRRGWRTCFGTTTNTETVVNTYQRSKVVLNHATDIGQPFGWGYGLQCRHWEVGMTGTCLLTNRTYDEFQMGGTWSFGDEGELLRMLGTLISSPHIAQNSGEELLHEIRLQHMPEHRAQQLVEFIERNA